MAQKIQLTDSIPLAARQAGLKAALERGATRTRRVAA